MFVLIFLNVDTMEVYGPFSTKENAKEWANSAAPGEDYLLKQIRPAHF